MAGIRTYSDESLREAIATSRSLRQALIKLGLAGAGGNYRTIKKEIARLGLDTSHMTGQAWLSGGSHSYSKPKPLVDVLVEDSDYNTSYLKNRLITSGLLAETCAKCGIDSWQGKSLSLHLDHVNGVNTDNRLENLRLLCPNCHSQTPTYCGRNKKPKRNPDSN